MEDFLGFFVPERSDHESDCMNADVKRPTLSNVAQLCTGRNKERDKATKIGHAAKIPRAWLRALESCPVGTATLSYSATLLLLCWTRIAPTR
jgi:hypothetical protein